MIKKIITIALILLLGAACITAGCLILNPNTPKEEVTEQPGVTITDGRVLPGTAPTKYVEGKITKLTDDKMFLSVQGVTWEMTLTEESRAIVDRMNELDIEVKVGTLVTVQYVNVNEDRIVKNVLRVDAN